ncbi:MAG: hypothetical protein PHY46_04975, partial [Candidatus Omnitrophica bacterium]|nr:hypothetical protein [Candidatus Omnitrophota bacterium]
VKDVIIGPLGLLRFSKNGAYAVMDYMNYVVKLMGKPEKMMALFDKLLVMLAQAKGKTLEYLVSVALDVYAPLAFRLGLETKFYEIRDLVFRRTEPESYEEVVEAVEAVLGVSYEKAEECLRDISAKIEQKLNDLGINVIKVEYRVKTPYSIHEKINNPTSGYNSVDQLKDVLGIHIVTDEASYWHAIGDLIGWEELFADVVGGRLTENFPRAREKGDRFNGHYFRVVIPVNNNKECLLEIKVFSETNYNLFKYSFKSAIWIYEALKRNPGQKFNLDGLAKLYDNFEDNFNAVLKFLENWIFVFVYSANREGNVVLVPVRLKKGAIVSDFLASYLSNINDFNADYSHYTVYSRTFTPRMAKNQKPNMKRSLTDELKNADILSLAYEPIEISTGLKSQIEVMAKYFATLAKLSYSRKNDKDAKKKLAATQALLRGVSLPDAIRRELDYFVGYWGFYNSYTMLKLIKDGEVSIKSWKETFESDEVKISMNPIALTSKSGNASETYIHLATSIGKDKVGLTTDIETAVVNYGGNVLTDKSITMQVNVGITDINPQDIDLFMSAIKKIEYKDAKIMAKESKPAHIKVLSVHDIFVDFTTLKLLMERALAESGISFKKTREMTYYKPGFIFEFEAEMPGSLLVDNIKPKLEVLFRDKLNINDIDIEISSSPVEQANNLTNKLNGGVLWNTTMRTGFTTTGLASITSSPRQAERLSDAQKMGMAITIPAIWAAMEGLNTEGIAAFGGNYQSLTQLTSGMLPAGSTRRARLPITSTNRTYEDVAQTNSGAWRNSTTPAIVESLNGLMASIEAAKQAVSSPVMDGLKEARRLARADAIYAAGLPADLAEISSSPIESNKYAHQKSLNALDSFIAAALSTSIAVVLTGIGGFISSTITLLVIAIIISIPFVYIGMKFFYQGIKVAHVLAKYSSIKGSLKFTTPIVYVEDGWIKHHPALLRLNKELKYSINYEHALAYIKGKGKTAAYLKQAVSFIVPLNWRVKLPYKKIKENKKHISIKERWSKIKEYQFKKHTKNLLLSFGVSILRIISIFSLKNILSLFNAKKLIIVFIALVTFAGPLLQVSCDSSYRENAAIYQQVSNELDLVNQYIMEILNSNYDDDYKAEALMDKKKGYPRQAELIAQLSEQEANMALAG